ncbi:hypothetical protein CBW65_01615 [Tumebacillus avium]|uniref:PucR C-terminal helix-turn-helix domain-containing protein n=1 Tax=Tumebacillus avium TaxID=1903704 RepID=A0A1Y0IHX8_9BACL|nr:PucR family transcriptional regulator [Tumebacillus avium]ARU59900.1 hypothetical protein CBW65_01615 [Tumebacillus avium]
MSSMERLAAALQEYGRVERREQVAKEICYVNDSWLIPLNAEQQLRVERAALPLAVAELLALYAGAVTGGVDARRQAAQWLCGEREADGDALAAWLQELGWARDAAGRIVLLEFARAAAAELAEEAVLLLQELIGTEQAVVGQQGGQRIWVLLPLEPVQNVHEQTAQVRDVRAREVQMHDELEQGQLAQASSLLDTVIAWIETLGAELFLLSRAGVSGARSLHQLAGAKEEAEFALEAGKLLPGKRAVHDYDRLGIARLLYGAPQTVREKFVREILPPDVLEALTPELRETAAVFAENGQGVAETARALFVHRNTLLYRLERIHELTGCDPRRPLDGWTLWLALLLVKTGCTSGKR